MKAAIIVAALALSACSGLRPDFVEAALVHQSHPMSGPGPEPIGGPGLESTLNGIEGVAGWERGPWFLSGGMTYALRDRNIRGGPWIAELRAGARVRLP